MKKLLLLAVLTPVISVSASTTKKLIIVATLISHAEIPELIKSTLAKGGVDLQIKVFIDYVQPNVQVAEKRLDANYFQTLSYLENFNKGKGTNLVTVTDVHVEPSDGYSRKCKSLAELPDGATVAIPSKGSNSGRTLLLLQKAGPLRLKGPNNVLATPRDVVENPKNLRFKEFGSALLPHMLDQVDLDPINTSYALGAKLSPAKDAPVPEDRDPPYVNYLVAHPNNKDSDALKKLSAALTNPEMRAFTEKRYAGAVAPAF